jgi:hypothetical protein
MTIVDNDIVGEVWPQAQPGKISSQYGQVDLTPLKDFEVRSYQTYEPLSKRFSSAKIRRIGNFNRRHIVHIPRIEIFDQCRDGSKGDVLKLARLLNCSTSAVLD